MKKLPKYNTDNIRKKLVELRERDGFTKAELAERANVNYNTVVKIESGENKNPTIKTLISIAKVFKIRLEVIVS